MRLYALVVLCACAGDPAAPVDAAIDAYVPMDAMARARSFEQIVMPLVTECIGNGACHRSQPPVLTSYAAMTSLPELEARYTAKPGLSNILVTKGGSENTHQGLFYFSTVEQAQIAAWIDRL